MDLKILEKVKSAPHWNLLEFWKYPENSACNIPGH